MLGGWNRWALGAAILALGGMAWAEPGPVTGQPLPRFVTIKAKKANARRGPGLDHKIDWVFMRRGLPVRVVAEYGHWRKIEDVEGEGGWIHYALLSSSRSVLIHPDMISMRFDPSVASQIKARLEAGVVAEVEACTLDWCYLLTPEQKGWVRKTGIWGIAPEDVFE